MQSTSVQDCIEVNRKGAKSLQPKLEEESIVGMDKSVCAVLKDRRER